MGSEMEFEKHHREGYTFKGDRIFLGAAIYEGTVLNSCPVEIPLRTLNRHGLITGATGTGKTKTLQIIAEQLSACGIPSLLMDIKGDLSGIAVPGSSNAKIEERHQAIGLPFEAAASPVEFLTLSEEKGVRLRATVTEFGPVLLGKILSLNDTQSSLLSVVFKYCDDTRLALIDLKDLRRVLQHIQEEGKEEFEGRYGRVSSSTVGIITRRIVELESQGAELFFGERSFEVDDLCRQRDGKGVVSILRLTDLQDRPRLFSTFMLQLLAEVYGSFPETGDADKPRLTIFIDEAHLVFQEASKALLNQIETVIRLIRSKGVGVFFITQSPTDVPDIVLSQLGLKVQHALRAFTAKDRKAIKLAAENFPISRFYDTVDLLTRIGTGEALVTALDEKGRPTPLAHTMLRAPQSRMDVLSTTEIDQIISRSALVAKYAQTLDRDSAFEILNAKNERIREQAEREEKAAAPRRSTTVQRDRPATTSSPAPRRRGKSTIEKALDNTVTRQMGRTFMREVTRGLLGMLGVGSKKK